MKTYSLKQNITIAAPLEEVWAFFSDPYNLAKISPGYMDFRIVHCPETAEIYDGMLIEYRIKPVLGVPLRWVTLIKKVKPGTCFMDTQVAGPYALWEHTHTFQETGTGTYMQDEVKYALPLGVLGRLAHTLFVKRQLKGIFDYRERVIHNLFHQ